MPWGGFRNETLKGFLGEKKTREVKVCGEELVGFLVKVLVVKSR